MIYSIAFVCILFGILLLFFLRREEKSYGALAGERIYQDTEEAPGETLSANTIGLKGRPDSLIKEGEFIIPVEIKTGKTPASPYENHTMQLMAYCLLVEETYGIRPPGGYLKYPEKEFKLAYTKEAEDAVRALVYEISLKKTTDEEQHCSHPEHNLPS